MARRICSVEGCAEYAHGHGKCKAHYERVYKPCSVEGCTKPLDYHGMCAMHRLRVKTHGSTELPPRNTPERELQCKVKWCTNLRRARGYCPKHYKRLTVHGSPTRTKNRPYGQGTINEQGYRLIKKPDHPNANANGYIHEHRLAMSDHLGRPLFKGENVHHINGHRADNQLENLELWVTIQPSGQKPEDLVKWARIILERYG